ncbi:tripartite motif-containing protein 16 isoform X1 [Fundulus heteroclitus]|uniref:tripartite motif-containing protein 16 isoform X1 n=1 Tax=Fundulus heteroclitus TaxID=8078 RepID=UPI00165BF9D8|nr:tripartite motif-containing protein 16 isoform X1 [Fundulus heteroclitus]
MEEPHIPVSVNRLSCRICRNLLRNPATIPCGHNFCLDCIEGRWDGEQSDLGCPECGQRFPSRPGLIRNTTLAQMIGDMERSRKRKEEAAAECLPKRGRSSGDTPGSALCWRHDSPLDYYCSTDGKIICAECALDKHNGHVVALVNEERRRKQEELRVVQTKLKETLQEQQKQQENLKRTFDQTERQADKTKDDCETAIVRVIDGLQRHYLSVRKLIEAQVEAAEAQICASLQRLETKIEEVKKMCSELDLLAESDNSVLFLQEWPSMQSVCEKDLLLSFSEAPEDPLLPIEVTKRAIDQLGRQLEDFCDQQFASIAQTCNVDQDESVGERGVEDQQQRGESSVGFIGGNVSKKVEEPITRDDFLQYACDLSLDPTTAHKDLIISPGDKEVKLSDIRCQTPASRHSERFTHRHQVLCREGLQAERCYYEVEVRGDKAEIALAYKGMDRRSSLSKSGFGANAKSWSLDRNNFYSVSHKSESVQLTQRPSAKKIGVYLKFKEGTLSFYEVSDSMRFLYKVEAEFTEPLYPGFWLDDKCCIRICDLKRRQQ